MPSKKAHVRGLYFFLDVSEYSYYTDTDSDERADLVEIQREIGLEHIVWSTEEFPEEDEGSIESEREVSDKSWRNISGFPLETSYREEDRENPDHIEYREEKYFTADIDDTLFVIVFRWEDRIEGDPIDLSTQETREVSEETRDQKCHHDHIEVSSTFSGDRSGFPEKYHEKSYDSTDERKVIISWSKKEFREIEDIAFEEISYDELFISPLSEEVSDTSEEEDSDRGWDDHPIRKYRTSKSSLPWKMMEEYDKKEPSESDQESKSVYFYAKNFYCRIHERELKSKREKL